MKDQPREYWRLRLENCKRQLEKNLFEVFLVKDTHEARNLVLENILNSVRPKVVSWGDSMTLHSTGILDEIRKNPEIRLIETFETGVPRDEIIERRRHALLSDIFFMGCNAVTEKGELVNLDMVGNRVSAVSFGPETVIVLIGRNKIVKDLTEAVGRIKRIAAPMNAIRHDQFRTPCMKAAFCMDCSSHDRICNVWSITERSHPKGRIKVIIIDRDLGL
ncbi:MAG: lactate utilization protein [Desulfobacteraceae bacterium]|nr:MAG: lactate utilization protein [Desulfobacteraceae bacterium]